MVTTSSPPDSADKPRPWRELVAPYEKAETLRSLWQIANSVLPYFLLLYVMTLSLKVSYWLALVLAPLAAGFLMRTFIIFHDCGHRSFFASQKANDVAGIITGVITLTPYYYWTRSHAIHHATAGDLSRRGTGDVMVLTVNEYLALSPLKKLGYRLYRNPIIMFLIGPAFVFLIAHRFAKQGIGKRELNSVLWTNLAIAGMLALMIWLMGLRTFLLVQLPVWLIGFSLGVWLFYVQHQFEGTYWESHERWNFMQAALYGASFYKLPKILQWFSGNIGFHHIHHLSPRIPNYKLEKCYQENELFRSVKPLTLLSSLRTISLRLWDEEQRKLVGFTHLKKLPANEPTAS